MIPQRSISRISNTLAERGGRRVVESVIERDYCLAWFLCGLAGHPLRDALAFKGGTCLRRCWFADYRFSEDLDFTLTRDTPFSQIREGLDEIFAAIEGACGMRMVFDREDRQSHRNAHTFYLRYRGPLPAENDVKVDVTITERLCFPLKDRPILRSYDEYDDLPQGPTVRVYSLEEIVLEKLVALSDRARNSSVCSGMCSGHCVRRNCHPRRNDRRVTHASLISPGSSIPTRVERQSPCPPR